MSTYVHLQQVKKGERLPMVEKVGVCLTCVYWDAETPRPPQDMVNELAICAQPELKPYAVVVSGSSGCNHWKDKADAGAQAHQYAENGLVA